MIRCFRVTILRQVYHREAQGQSAIPREPPSCRTFPPRSTPKRGRGAVTRRDLAYSIGVMKGLEGKVALVTGGGKGVGRAISLALAARGVRVLVTGRDERTLGETVGEVVFGGGKARHLVGDVRDRAHLDAAVARALEVFGGLDFVVANASMTARSDLGEAELSQVDAIIGTNLLGAYYTFHICAPHLREAGRFVAMSSPLATRGAPGYAAYCASQAGILGLVRAAATELGARKITCNAVVPGWVDAHAAQATPPESIAETVVLLCSGGASGVTGQAIMVGIDAAVPDETRRA